MADHGEHKQDNSRCMAGRKTSCDEERSGKCSAPSGLADKLKQQKRHELEWCAQAHCGKDSNCQKDASHDPVRDWITHGTGNRLHLFRDKDHPQSASAGEDYVYDIHLF